MVDSPGRFSGGDAALAESSSLTSAVESLVALVETTSLTPAEPAAEAAAGFQMAATAGGADFAAVATGAAVNRTPAAAAPATSLLAGGVGGKKIAEGPIEGAATPSGDCAIAMAADRGSAFTML